MKEIEVKAKLNNRDAVVSALKKLGAVFEPPIIQRDVIYWSGIGDFTKTSTDIILRIREKEKSGKIILLFTLKKPVKNELDCIEHEVTIDNKNEMDAIIRMLGYLEAVRIVKTRQSVRYNNLEINLDDIENLGSFIEAEKLAQEADSEHVQEELFKFLESLGIARADRITIGYDTMMYKKLHGK